ncbi:unnamed protein product [Orchesella dallaii]|uniref:PH domain-containing protein n=1 Tax=Orchesella dallaii TaxID=48710 RepID=A0ABP1Q113_9HEXA
MSSPCVIVSPAYHGVSSKGLSSADSYDLSPSANEIMRGPLTLLSSSHGPQRVIVSVFRTSVDHFSLVYPDNGRKMIACKPVGCINIRGVTCENTTLGSGIKGFTLRPKKCDTSSAALIFVCQDESDLPRWMAAFEPLTPSYLGSRKIPRQCSLPSVEEEE